MFEELVLGYAFAAGGFWWGFMASVLVPLRADPFLLWGGILFILFWWVLSGLGLYVFVYIKVHLVLVC
jgi:hypothetical protein